MGARAGVVAAGFPEEDRDEEWEEGRRDARGAGVPRLPGRRGR